MSNTADAQSIADRDEPITRDDLVSGFRELQETGEETAETAKTYALAAGAALVVILVGMAFLAGRKRGKRKSTVVEIRRI